MTLGTGSPSGGEHYPDPADHAWQNDAPGAADRVFRKEDFCGFWLDTPDGSIWAVGDSG